MTTYSELKKAALLADKQYSDALVKVYGRKAGDMRYRRDVDHPPEVLEARQRKIEADQAQNAAWEAKLHITNP